jgi:uncharacterized protein (TIGR02118 family)
MIVITFILRRRPELSADEFHRYWREQHAPLVAAHAGTLGIRKYIQLHTIDSPLAVAIAEGRGCEPTDYDGIAILWFDGAEALVAAASTPGGVAGSAALLEDERTFIDLARCQLWISEDHTVIG